MKWIKLSDEMPPIKEMVLTWSIYNKPDFAEWTGGEYFQHFSQLTCKENITHWARIEAPNKG